MVLSHHLVILWPFSCVILSLTYPWIFGCMCKHTLNSLLLLMWCPEQLVNNFVQDLSSKSNVIWKTKKAPIHYAYLTQLHISAKINRQIQTKTFKLPTCRNLHPVCTCANTLTHKSWVLPQINQNYICNKSFPAHIIPQMTNNIQLRMFLFFSLCVCVRARLGAYILLMMTLWDFFHSCVYIWVWAEGIYVNRDIKPWGYNFKL